MLREGAAVLERAALQKRQRADMVELSIITAALTSTDATGKRGIDLLVELDPMRALDMLKALYARIAMLAVQIPARD